MIHVVLTCGCGFYRSPKGFGGDLAAGDEIWCHEHPHDPDWFDPENPDSYPPVYVVSIQEWPTVADLVGSDPGFTGGQTAEEYVRRLRG